MSGILRAAVLPFMGCITLLVTMVLQVLSYAAPFWAYNNQGDFGLWRNYRCIATADGSQQSDLGCYKNDHPWYIADWLDAVRAMESLAIIFWAIPLIILPVYMYVSLGLYYRCMLGTLTGLTLLAAICNLIGFLIYAAQISLNESWSTGWCFVLCVIADGFGFLAFVIFLVSTCSPPKFALDTFHTSAYYVHPDRNVLYVINNVESDKDGSIFNGGHMNHVLADD